MIFCKRHFIFTSSGKKELPSIEDLIEKVFKRTTFIPDKHDTNLLFQYYALHFIHQFFRKDKERGSFFRLDKGGVSINLFCKCDLILV